MKKVYLNFKTIFLILSFIFTGYVKAQVITLGSGTNSGGSTVAGPINQYYASLHCQIVYTAAEITAAGGAAGPITKFGFNIVTGVSTPLPNYTIQMKHTTATNVASYDGTGLSQVYTTSAYTPVIGGFDLLALNTPFIWNGTSNILVDVCFDQISQDNATGTVMLYTPNVANGFIFTRSDAAPQCGVACSTTSNKKPQAQMYFPYPIDLGVSAFLKPSVTKKCFGNDTIRVRVMNNGTANLNFATQPATITVKATGPSTNNTYTLALSGGVLNSLTYLDTTVTTAFNMPLLGTYNLKGYSTLPFDANATNDTTKISVTKKAFFGLTALPNDSICRGIPLQLNATVYPPQAGHDSIRNTSTSYPAPYGNFYEGAKHQFLFLASELNAAGVVPGNIQSIAFDAVNLNNTDPLTNFNVAMLSTTLTTLTQIETGLTTVYTAPSYTPVLGSNTHAFSTPFVWNGTDNLIIETCFNNTPNGYSSNVTFNQSILPFNASAWYNHDGVPTLCSSSGAGASLSTERPNVLFGQTPPALTYSWTPASVLTASNIPNPIANIPTEGATVFTVSVNYTANNCSSYDTLRIFVKQTPTLNLGHDTTVCTGSYLLNGGIHASSYQWSTGATTSTISVAATGYYSATATSSVGCVKKDTVHITFNSKPIVTLGHDSAFCQGSTIELNAGNPGSAHTWGKVGGGFSAFTQTVNVNSTGTYFAVVTSSLSTSCTASDTIMITMKTKPNVSLAFNSPPLLMCQFNSPRPLNEGTPGGGTYIGPGVNGSSFDPALVGPGIYVIVYTYTGPNSCTNQAQDTLKVKACVGIEEYGDNATLNIYPNPNKGNFTIAVNSGSDVDAALQILTVDGRVVFEGHITAGPGMYEKQVDISGLADGIYYLKMQSAKATKSYKILKQ